MSKSTVLFIIFAIGFALQACHIGRTVDSFPPARTPKGIAGHVLTSRGDYTMELIEVRDDGLVILTSRTFRFVAYAAIASARFDGVGDSISDRRAPSNKT